MNEQLGEDNRKQEIDEVDAVEIDIARHPYDGIVYLCTMLLNSPEKASS